MSVVGGCKVGDREAGRQGDKGASEGEGEGTGRGPAVSCSRALSSHPPASQPAGRWVWLWVWVCNAKRTARSSRGAVTVKQNGPCHQRTPQCVQSIPGSAASRVPSCMRAIQRLAGSKHPWNDALAEKRMCYSRLVWPPPPRSSPLEIRDYLMLQPCSHYPKVC